MGLPKEQRWKSSHIFPSDFSTKRDNMLVNQLFSKNGGGKKGITSLEKFMNDNDTRNRMASKSEEGKVAHLGWHFIGHLKIVQTTL